MFGSLGAYLVSSWVAVLVIAVLKLFVVLGSFFPLRVLWSPRCAFVYLLCLVRSFHQRGPGCGVRGGVLCVEGPRSPHRRGGTLLSR